MTRHFLALFLALLSAHSTGAINPALAEGREKFERMASTSRVIHARGGVERQQVKKVGHALAREAYGVRRDDHLAGSDAWLREARAKRAREDAAREAAHEKKFESAADGTQA